MQYIWQHRLWPNGQMRTVDGQRISVINPGQLNTNSGPDFFNAKISIGDNMWAGDVEIHVRASDWHRHGHDGDPAYDSVILHVVDRDDAQISRSDGQTIPQMVMPCNPTFYKDYATLVDRSDLDLPCAGYIGELQQMFLTDWMTALAYERLYSKTDRIDGLLKRFDGDWESACYVTVARCLGFGINGDPFERLALSLPLSFIGKHADSLPTIEAMLFGQSGLLEQAASEPYTDALRAEYRFASHKFGLKPVVSPGWKMSRMRPANQPHRRIATLAAMLCGGFRMLSRFLSITTEKEAAEILNPVLTGYWLDHYTFGSLSPHSSTGLSRSSVDSLIINAVVPLQMAYAVHHDNTPLADNALALLQSLPAEKNSIVDIFSRSGMKIRDAFCSQAVIQLRRQYCDAHKCLYCRIGHRMLSGKVSRRVNA